MTYDEIIKGYQDLIILQYWDKPKARATIETIIKGLINAGIEIQAIPSYFDLDNAQGIQLDVLGRIVGVSRTVKDAMDKIFFGFEGNPNVRGFGMAPFKTLETYPYYNTELDDYQYRFFIKAKIAKNFFSGAMSGERGLIEVLNFIFENKIYVVDNLDMSVKVYIHKGIDETMFRYIIKSDLFPKPAGVRIEFIGYLQEFAFGFEGNPHARGFGMAPFAVYFDRRIYG
ncbi:MAG: DUF2612 domain-containing protein [Campylobacteraceae bacterium]|nr:DUF2612 domain-containing protein [Campylobacteraceae bacterium]